MSVATAAIVLTILSPHLSAQTKPAPAAAESAVREGVVRENTVGFVMEVSGTWLLDGKPPRRLAGGDELPSGGSLRPEKADEETYIIVGLYNGKAERFKKATKLPEREVASTVQRIWQAVMPRYRNGLAPTVSRGTGLLQNGVVELKEGRVDLGSALAELPSGKWTVRLTRLPADAGEPQVQKRQVEWDVDDTESAWIAADGIQSGLYELSLISQRSGRAIESPAVVLVASSDDFAARQTAYAEAVKLTESWDEETQSEVADRFLQAFLVSLTEKHDSDGDPGRE